MDQTILTIDVGTSSMRGILFSSKGTMLHTSQNTYAPICKGNMTEIPAALLSDALISICRNCASYAGSVGSNICGISFTSQRSSFLPVDKDGNPLMNFITWQDRRCLPVCSSLREYNDYIYKKTGLSLSHVPLAPKLMWYILTHPELDKKTARYLTIADYLIYLMTGEYKTDYTYGSRTLLMDIHTLTWDEDLLDIFHIKKEKLCTLVPQGSIVGTLTDSFAQLTGLDGHSSIAQLTSGLPVISAGGDQQCSMLGSLCASEGDILITAGTGSYVAALTDQVHLADHSIICGVSAIPGKYQLEATILAGADIFNWYYQTFYPGASGYDDLNREIAASPMGSNGIIALPHFRGKGSPNWNPNAAGLFYGVNSQCTRGDFARSILEGIAFEIAENLTFLQKELHSNTTITAGADDCNFKIKVAGGLTNCPPFNQMLSNICGQNAEKCLSNETTAIGAYISAQVGLGLSDNFPSAVSWFSAQFPNTNGSNVDPPQYLPCSESMENYAEIQKKRNKIYHDLFSEPR